MRAYVSIESGGNLERQNIWRRLRTLPLLTRGKNIYEQMSNVQSYTTSVYT